MYKNYPFYRGGIKKVPFYALFNPVRLGQLRLCHIFMCKLTFPKICQTGFLANIGQGKLFRYDEVSH